MKKIDIPCICGHSKKAHKPNLSATDTMIVCKATKRSDNGSGMWADNCFKYVPDNLSYIEKIAKQKGLA
jgi:hypothetical protein